MSLVDIELLGVEHICLIFALLMCYFLAWHLLIKLPHLKLSHSLKVIHILLRSRKSVSPIIMKALLRG